MADISPSPSFCFVYCLLERLGCSEARHVPCRNLDLLLGLGIDTSSGLLVDNHEGAQISNSDLTVLLLQ